MDSAGPGSGGMPGAGADGETGAREQLRKDLGERSPDMGTEAGDDLEQAAAIGRDRRPAGRVDPGARQPTCVARSGLQADAMTTRWLFADQLGPQFLDAPDQPVLLVESRAVFRRRRFHRAKAHLLLSACATGRSSSGPGGVPAGRHLRRGARAAREAVRRSSSHVVRRRPLRRAARLRGRAGGPRVRHHPRGVRRLGQRPQAPADEDFYRWQRVRFGLLMDGDEPAGGRWNLDHDNREPPPRRRTLGLEEPWLPGEDDVDAQVREDLDRWERDGLVSFVGDDAPAGRPATRWEALARLDHFVAHRLADFGPTEDAMLGADPWMAHSALSPAMNLGLLTRSRPCTPRSALPGGPGTAQQRRGLRPPGHRLAGVRLVAVLALPRGLPGPQRPGGDRDVPEWFRTLDAGEQVTANCLASVLRDLRHAAGCTTSRA
jgi:deoxyribodipyrimidine photolyase-related protein